MNGVEQNRDPSGPQIFDGLRVIDFTAVIAGSYCTRLMADLGAEVIKIEHPSGEILRHAGPMRNNTSALFSAMNSGKRCVTLDLKQQEAVIICKELITTCDVVVENFAPGVIGRLGLDYDTLSTINPKLIMCSVSGYGQSGPESDRPAYAPIVQATSGYEYVYLRNQPDLTKPLNMGLPIGDTSAAQQAFGAISAALFYRERTGIGQYIDIAMQDILLANMHKDFQTAALGEMNDRHYGPLETKDGFVIVVPLNPHHFETLVEIVGEPELLQDPLFATTTARIYNYDHLQKRIEKWTKTQTCDQAIDAFEKSNLPCGRYRGIGDLKADPQLLHRGMLTQIEDQEGSLDVPNSPFLFSKTNAAVGKSVPRLGEDNRKILEQVGIDESEIDNLIAQGVLGQCPEEKT